jgi:hypothetical protein
MVLFNPEKHKLTQICKRGHDYLGTGKSLRYLSSNNCVDCSAKKAASYPAWRRKKYSTRDQRLKWARNYNNRHREEINRKSTEYRRKNKDIIDKKRKELLANPAHIKRRRRAIRLNATFLSDTYVKTIIFQTTGIKTNDPDIIQAKREQLTLTRLIREGKEAGNGNDSNRDK